MAKDKRIEPSELYTDNVGLWQFRLDNYEGGESLLKQGYLYQHQRELAKDYMFRMRRATPPGFAAAVINTYKSLISRAAVSRETESEDFKRFLEKDCNRRGNSLEQFIMESAFPIAQAVGWTWVLVDAPPQQADDNGNPVTISLAEQRERNLFPYCVHYDPTQVINWDFDGFGNLLWITVRTPSKLDGVTGKVIPQGAKLWDAFRWRTYDDKGRALEEGAHMLGVVPFVILYNDRSARDLDMGISAIKNIAYLNRELLNLRSLLQEFMFRQCFSQLVLDEDTATTDGIKAIGTSNAIPVKAGGIVPEYIAPSINPAEFLMRMVDADISEIWHEAGLIDRSAQQVGQAQSGISRAFEFHNTNTLLNRKAKNLEQFEKHIAELWFKWQGEENDYKVAYPDNFDIRDVTQELDEAERIFKLPIKAPTLKRVRAQRLANILTPEADEEDRNAMKEEIEANDFGSNGKAENGNGQPQVSPLAQRFGIQAAQ